ncbi:MAG TPA: 2-dehydropantoate 2-reductase [Thermomicrobiales bacterium]|jgi:2-dehydropantoate 2-reductase
MSGNDLRSLPITIVGAGAIGGTVGAFLHDTGYNVTLVDVDVAHVRAINEHGLRMVGIRGDRTFRVPAIERSALRGPLGVVFLCVKGHFTAEAIRDLAPLLAPDGFVLSLQNGLNEAVIAQAIGPERTVGAFVHFGADLIEPGLIQLGTEQTIFIGELDGQISPRAEALCATLAHVMPARATANIWGFLWGKLVYGALAFAASSVDAPVPTILDDPLGRTICRAAADEAYLVASTQAQPLEPIGEFEPNDFAPGQDTAANASLDALAEAMRQSPKQHMGIWRDLKIKRRKTEVDVQVAVLVAKGREVGVPTPVNSAVLDIIHAIEDGKQEMDWDNLREIAQRAGLGALPSA